MTTDLYITIMSYKYSDMCHNDDPVLTCIPILTPVSHTDTYIASNPFMTPVDFLVHRTHRSI